MKKLLLLKALSALFFFLVSAYLGKTGQSTDATVWYYAAATITCFLLFSYPIVDESLTVIDRFIKISLLSVLPLAIIFLLSLADCFDGPYATFCSWPTFTIIMAVMVFNIVISVITVYRITVSMELSRKHKNLIFE